jgi:translation initiation factor IF-2
VQPEVSWLPKTRVYQLAKDLGVKSDALIAALGHMGITGLSAASPIDEDTANAVRELLTEQLAKIQRAREAAQTAQAEPVETVEATKAKAEEVAQPVEAEEAEAAVEVVVDEAEAEVGQREPEPERVLPRRPSYFDEDMLRLERQLEALAAAIERGEEEAEESVRELIARPKGKRPSTAVEVPPVVTVLGHVDHGKTTLLDAIRHSQVTATEDGGITQHIGASEVEHNGKLIVFLDTPGHEAFTQLRARGAQVTDIAVLVVAADDGVMPQTIEALNHAKAAHVPIIVAINKIDLPNANPDRVRQQLAEEGLIPEAWGGDTVMVEVSALTGEGLDELLDMILVVAELEELWADPQANFTGVVVEALVDSSRGPVATVLTRSGTLRVGDVLLCGTAYGRVRRINDWRGRLLQEVGPGRPVEIIALNEVPEPGAILERVANIREARRRAEARREARQERERERLARRRVADVYAELTSQSRKVLRAIIKADVWGSAEALVDAIHRLASSTDELDVDVLHMGVGDVSESDVALAVASDASVIAFRVGVPPPIRQMANDEGVTIREYQVIYDAIDVLKAELEGMLEPTYREDRIGRAEVLKVFSVRGFPAVAGCRIVEGRLQRGATIVVTRGGNEVFRGTLDSLHHFDRSVQTLEAPNECGVGSTQWGGWQPGDIIEAWVRTEIRPTLRVQETNSGIRP